MMLTNDPLAHLDEAALLASIDAHAARPTAELDDASSELFDSLLARLEGGVLRAARPVGDGWEVVPAVKRGILMGFRLGAITQMGGSDPFIAFSDKHTYPPQALPLVERQIRMVPGGTSVRRGAYVGPRVTIMPPAFINVGAYVGEGTMVDSHALVGSCAQIGARVHLSAAAQVGGVLEPVGQLPVIIEDDVLIGGNTGIFEGVRVSRGAVIAAGVVLTGSTPVYDLIHGQILRPTAASPLVIPPGAVVVPGSRPASGEFAAKHGLQVATPLIVKYRDASTDARTALEEALR
jgi:2,3,4,5-tetrahydropyridine-2,6-dicarboxylate N-succinyltransferase